MRKTFHIVTYTFLLVMLVLSLCVFSLAIAESANPDFSENSIITFGRYEQDNKTENGKEPIEWTILETKEDRALLISNKVLDCQKFNENNGDTTWADCSLRKWLNEDFYNAAFTAEEATLIINVSVENGPADQAKVSDWIVGNGSDTEDKIWLLSFPQVKKYFDQARCLGTEYANAKGAKAGLFAAESNWFTRSIGKTQEQVTFVHDNFEPKTTSAGSKMGIRPAMWISMSEDWSVMPYQRFQKALSLAEKGEYTEAYQITDALNDYNNNIEISAHYRFDWAKATMDNGNYATALELFDAYSTFVNENGLKLLSDFETVMPECCDKLACQYKDTGDHEKAVALYTSLAEKYPAAATNYWYAYATSVMNNGDYAEAISLYKSYKAFTEECKVRLNAEYEKNLPECYNQLALQNLTTGDHDAAIELYTELADYKADIAVSYWFDYATAVRDSGNSETAISLFHSYYDYVSGHNLKLSDDYSTALPECYYQLGMTAMQSGDFKSAITHFAQMGQYKDVMEQLMICFDKTHTQYRWLTQNTGSVVNAGNKGYAESNPITGDDPHFGWNLGRFMMSGYTEVDENGDYPIFIKTPGDNLVLWFDLDQDIDCLNGNDKLSVSKDSDGFDQELGFPKTNMGRGALLLKHTDFRNSDSTPLSYLDYLSATRSGAANTRVEVKEEGIYEAALDYELYDSNILHAFSSINNYRIAFKFAVKNGSAMFFMFDLGTGAELEDYSRAADGFKIDFANSHSLKVDVIRYALNQNADGLDIRANAPASDGDEFDRAGYYEITIENTETGEKMTKHIFVGGKGDLADYQSADARMDQFKK